MTRIDTFLSKSKQGASNEVSLAEPGEKTLVSSGDCADVYKVSGEELLVYSSKSSEKEKLTGTLNDSEVESVHLSNGKPALVVHSKYGTMTGDFTTSANNAAKQLKNTELPLLTNTAKGDGGLVMSIHKIKETTSCVDLINDESISLEAAAFLWTAIDGKIKPVNLLIVGNGADRFEFLNAISAFIPVQERVAIVNGKSSSLHSTHWNSLEMPFTQAMLKASEMKYDRIIGEIESKTSRQLHALTGKMKGLLTMPGNNALEAINVLKATGGKGANVIDVVVSVHGNENNGIKVTEIAEVQNGQVKSLFLIEGGKLVPVRLESELVKHGVYRGISGKAITNAIEEKTQTLAQWNATGIRSNAEIRQHLTQ